MSNWDFSCPALQEGACNTKLEKNLQRNMLLLFFFLSPVENSLFEFTAHMGFVGVVILDWAL